MRRLFNHAAIALLGIIIALGPLTAFAAPPQTINYQGYLVSNPAGTAISGATTINFRLYATSTGGVALWAETQSVTVSNGNFSAVLGAFMPFGLPFDAPYWLGVQVGTDPEMSPRQPLTASPYALRAANADAVATSATIAASQISGTISTANLPPCAANEILKYNGSAWVCAAASAGGTVSSVSTGSGLTGGPITATGTIGLAATQLLPAAACAANQIPKWSGTAWACAVDVDTNSGGTVTSITAGAGLTGGTITGSGTIAIDLASSVLDANFIKQGGNAQFTVPATIGTTTNLAVNVIANNRNALRLEPNSYGTNIIGGYSGNSITAGALMAIVAGGGKLPFADPVIGGLCRGNNCANRVTDHAGTVSGGGANQAGDDAGTALDRPYATVAGGYSNMASGAYGTVSGGEANTSSGHSSFVGGGNSNYAPADYAVVTGGSGNSASGNLSTTIGGAGNSASGSLSTVLGGNTNTASGNTSLAAGYFSIASGIGSFALGTRAKTQAAPPATFVHDGAFVWADGNNFDFNTSASYEFAARATGGFRFVTAIDAAGVPTRTFGIGSNGAVTIPVNSNAPNLTLSQTVVNDFARLRLQTTTANFWDIASGFSDDRLNFYRDGSGNVMSLLPGNPADLLVMSNGAHLTAGGAWTNASDRNRKTEILGVDVLSVLRKVVALPLSTWRYKAEETGVRHIGPMAQDFRRSFGFGNDDKSIATVDADGVALAAIQGLHQLVKQKDERISQQESRIRQLEESLARIQRKLGLN